MVLISLSFCGWFIVLLITPSAANANGYLYATDILEACLRPMICALPVRHRLRTRCAVDTFARYERTPLASGRAQQFFGQVVSRPVNFAVANDYVEPPHRA
jgi:hypothetical protein